MGWNSWDSYGLSITEQEYLENASWMAAHLKKFGWEYALVDEGWYLPNPEAKPQDFEFHMDANGRYIPVANRFPSAANGSFTALAAKVHKLGLKFGIHIIRGIPKQAVAKDVTIASSSFKATDAADTGDTCPWNGDNYGVRNNPAGQAYYDSLFQLYAAWGVDYIKVDCISSHPYKGDEIEMISDAIKKTGRSMVLSLSPGPTPLDKASEVTKWANMWRISDDMWDIWKTNSDKTFPQDLAGQFQRAAAWAAYSGSGHWPDADMLPIGYLGPRPGNGKLRESDFKPEEQQTLMTLWCIFRSPLIMGGNLTKMDDATSALLTNGEVLAVDQNSRAEKQVSSDVNRILWKSDDPAGGYYLAAFNLGSSSRTFEWSWKQAELPNATYQVRDLWLHKELGSADKLKVTLKPHASALLRVY
jgi:alpha-galactosidase